MFCQDVWESKVLAVCIRQWVWTIAYSKGIISNWSFGCFSLAWMYCLLQFLKFQFVLIIIKACWALRVVHVLNWKSLAGNKLDVIVKLPRQKCFFVCSKSIKVWQPWNKTCSCKMRQVCSLYWAELHSAFLSSSAVLLPCCFLPQFLMCVQYLSA